MPEIQRAGSSTGHNQPALDLDIVVEEKAHYPWPGDMVNAEFGRPIRRIRYYFEPFLDSIRSIRKNYSWHAFYINPTTGRSYVDDYPNVVTQLERLFKDELGTPYSPAQYQLLVNSHFVIVAVSKKTQSIAGYFSASYCERNTIPGVDIPTTFGNHGVIARDHQQFNIGVTMGAASIMYGQRLRDFFRTIACVLRTNNRHILNPLRQAGTVYRSDQLAGDLSATEQQVRSAIHHMHSEVFQLSDTVLPFDQPLNIEHRFDPAFTIDGVESNQIIYICCVTSLSKCIYKLFARRPRRNKKA